MNKLTKWRLNLFKFLVYASIGSLVALCLWFLVGHHFQVITSVGNDTHSKSALGHLVFADALKREGYDVRIVHFDPAGIAPNADLMVVAEPYLNTRNPEAVETARQIQTAAHQLLVVAPKRWGAPQLPGEAHIHTHGIESVKNVHFALQIFHTSSLQVLRDGTHCGELSLENLQTLSLDGATALIECDSGALLSKFQNTYFLSDPDLIANHRLDEREMLDHALRVFNTILPPQTAGRASVVVFDETLHGHIKRPGLGEVMTRPPLLYFTLQLILLFFLGGWAASGRFGPAIATSLTLAPGKELLLQNTSELLNFSGYQGLLLSRYWQHQIDDISTRFHVTAQNTGDRVQTLQRIADSRGLEFDLIKLHYSVLELNQLRMRRPSRKVLVLARTIHRFRKEILDDTRVHTTSSS